METRPNPFSLQPFYPVGGLLHSAPAVPTLLGFSNIPSMILPQGLCTCCLCLECCPSRYRHGSLLSSFSSGLSVTISERPSFFRGSPVTFYPLRQLYFYSQYLPLADITSWFLYCLFLLLQCEDQEDGDFFFFCLVHCWFSSACYIINI